MSVIFIGIAMAKEIKGTIVFGLDPGVTRFGVVAIDDYKAPPIAWATFHSNSAYSGAETYHRVVSLTEQVTAWIRSQTAGYRHMVVVIEKPIYNRNPVSFEIQWRLFQQVLTILRHVAGPDWFLEVSPGTAKRCATGNGSATKLDMVLASHFDGPDWGKENQEALADAEGIANCWFTEKTVAYSPMSKQIACHVGPAVQGFSEP